VNLQLDDVIQPANATAGTAPMESNYLETTQIKRKQRCENGLGSMEDDIVFLLFFLTLFYVTCTGNLTEQNFSVNFFGFAPNLNSFV